MPRRLHSSLLKAKYGSICFFVTRPPSDSFCRVANLHRVLMDLWPGALYAVAEAAWFLLMHLGPQQRDVSNMRQTYITMIELCCSLCRVAQCIH